MKVFFYLDNSNKSDTDFSKPENGNPGIGGTEFMIWSISYYINLYCDDIEVSILAPIVDKMPKNINSIKCESICNSVRIANEMKVDVLVLRGAHCRDKKLFNLIDELKVKTIMWCHNFEQYDYLNLAKNTQYIKRNLCVSKEQYDRLRDHSIFLKSDYIFNAIDCSIYKNKIKDRDKKENIICYLGSITPLKGFHKLAEVWPTIEENFPECKLYVIGSGRLYNDNVTLGRYGIAEKSYEEKFMKYLVDENDSIKKNIKFFGDLSHEDKIKIMSQAKVGVLNPVAKDETFCISAIEFEILGVPVVARKTYGLLNTVKNNETGFLVKNYKELTNAILKLLEDDSLSYEFGKKAITHIKNNFDIYDICSEWGRIINEVSNDKCSVIDLKAKNYNCDLKWLREVNRRIKQISVLKWVPAILEYPEAIYNNKYYKKISYFKTLILK